MRDCYLKNDRRPFFRGATLGHGTVAKSRPELATSLFLFARWITCYMHVIFPTGYAAEH
jgi:hypothetical protein